MNKRKERIKKEKASTKKDGVLQGRLNMARNGTGFVIDPETDEAVWIEGRDLGTALPGDVVTVRKSHFVRAEAHPSRKSGQEGRIVSIDARAHRSIVGTVEEIGHFVRVQPLSPSFRQAFIVPSAKGATVGDRVVMDFVRWDDPRLAPEGEITEVIGPKDNPSLDTIAVMKQYELPESFSDDVLTEAELVADLKEGRRLDLRRKFIFTCDPATARDFDDALSLERDKNGNRVLGVHIADVSHYVRPGTALDREAYKRSTSVYLVGKVVPMLPEQLSNGVCSLVPNEDRLAFSAFLTFDADGRCIARRFAKSVIRSKARFTYEEVMDVLRGKGPRMKPAMRQTIRAIGDLAQQLRKGRFAAGALDMDVPEAEVILDETGMMTGVVVRPYDESHQLVEECMVAANEAVATELWTRGVKILARLHAPPDPDKMEELRANLAMLGLSGGDFTRPKNLSKFLAKLKGSPLEGVVSVMVLRSLKRALYSSKEIGHYGLAKNYYAHFTSPIRRYPDLVLHRQLASFIAGKGGRLDPGWLERTARHCSEREQVADDAERSLVEIKKFRYLEAQAGGDREFDAVIARCMHNGCFVELPELAAGGLIHISRLSEDYVRFDAFRECLEAGGNTWKVGDRLKVRVLRVDFDARQVDFVPASRGDQTPQRKRSPRSMKSANTRRAGRSRRR